MSQFTTPISLYHPFGKINSTSKASAFRIQKMWGDEFWWAYQYFTLAQGGSTFFERIF
jgi:hypothetical protein